MAEISKETLYDSKKVWLRGLLASVSYFSMGYSQVIFNPSQECISHLFGWGDEKDIYISVISSFLPLGAAMGAVIIGFLPKSYGKRRKLMIADIIMIAAGAIFMVPHTYTFGLARFLSGIAIGWFSMLTAQYIQEFTPADIRGKLGSLNGFAGLFGQLISVIVCLSLPAKVCPPSMAPAVLFLFAVPGVISLLQFLIFLKIFKMESPMWLVKIGQNDMAMKSCMTIYEKTHAQSQINLLIGQNTSHEGMEESKEFTLSEMLKCTKGSTKSTRLGILFHVVQQLSGINAILFYSTTLFKGFGDLSREMTIQANLSRVIAVLALFPVIDRFGRKPITVISTYCMGGCFLAIYLMLGFDGLELSLVVFIDLYLMLFGVSLGPICWIYTSEILNDKAMVMCTVLNWGTCSLVVLVFPLIIDSFGLPMVFLIFSGINIASAGYLMFDMIETKGMTRNDIRELFYKLR